VARGELFISFWHVRLSNLPVGTFVHRKLSGSQAKQLIAAARKTRSLRGVSGDDLFAPYNKDKRRNHDQLRAVLGKHYGIKLSLRDFVLEGEDGYSSMFPLQLMAIEGSHRLLVISCHYTMPRRRKRTELHFDVAPDSVTFHLFSAARGRSEARRARSGKRNR
jgi:hypothetical protein